MQYPYLLFLFTIKENKTLEQRGPWRIGFQINRCKVEGKKLEVERRIV